MNTAMNPNRVLAVLAAVTILLVQLAVFAHSTTILVA